MAFETSSVNVTSLVRALRAEGLYDSLAARLSAPARATLDNPMSAKWHAAEPIIEINMQLVALVGVERCEQLAYRAMKESVGLLLRPLMKVALLLGRGSPVALLSRVESMTRVTNRGLNAEWKASSPTNGVLRLDYGCECPREMIEPKWRGIFRFASELASQPVHVEKVDAPGHGVFEFHLSW